MSSDSRDLSGLSSDHLDRRLRQLRGDERNVQVEFLLHLLAFDERGGWGKLGYASLWKYCRCELRLLECAIWRRLGSMRVLRRFPFVVDYLRDGRIAMTTLVLVEKVLTADNAVATFDRISDRNAREVREIVAELEPRPDVPTSLRKLPEPSRIIRRNSFANSGEDTTEFAVTTPASPATLGATTAISAAAAEASATAALAGESASVDVMASADVIAAVDVKAPVNVTEGFDVAGSGTLPMPMPPAERIARRPAVEIEPLSRDRYLLKMTVDREFVDALDQVRSILSHVIPGGDRVAVIRRALDEIIRRDTRRHAMKVERRAKKQSPAAVSAAAAAAVINAETTSGAAASTVTTSTHESAAPADVPGRMSTAQAGIAARMSAAPDSADAAARVSQNEVPRRKVRTRDAVAAPVKNFGAKAKRAATPRSIAASVRARDGHCCSWKMAGGGVCGSTWQLEIDHIHPFALGGASTVENLRLVCRAHNQQYARRVFGDRVLERHRRERSGGGSSGDVQHDGACGARVPHRRRTS